MAAPSGTSPRRCGGARPRWWRTSRRAPCGSICGPSSRTRTTNCSRRSARRLPARRPDPRVIEKRHVILATAGHVDHGKTALVKALTGVDADRLPEEKARGITIELGFAHLELMAGDATELSVGVVDVPGHEDFVKNMVAGVGSIDAALLIVAANEGWMPQ